MKEVEPRHDFSSLPVGCKWCVSQPRLEDGWLVCLPGPDKRLYRRIRSRFCHANVLAVSSRLTQFGSNRSQQPVLLA
jgi:hypothetical protein